MPAMKMRRLVLVLSLSLVLVYLVWVTRGGQSPSTPRAHGEGGPVYQRYQTLPPLTLGEEEDFITFTGPRRSTAAPTIPHIIHQTWDTTNVPRYFAKFIRSWVKHHPDWEYWFWTEKDADVFIKREFPEYYTLYDSYIGRIYRADAIRYFILYKFGGVYVDLDTEALKPLNDWTFGYQCILSQESYEHSFVVKEKEHTNLINGFLATRPQHPFFLNLIESLPEFAGKYFGHYLKATGPLFLDAVYRRHKYNYTSLVGGAEDQIMVVPPKFFSPTFDPSQSEIISSRCYPLVYKQLKPKGQRTCKHVQDKFFQNKPEEESYTNHEWIHAHELDQNWKTENTLPVSQLAPGFIKPVERFPMIDK